MPSDDILGLIACFVWPFCIGIAAGIGSERGRGWLGAGLGLVAGPLGILAAAMLPRTARGEARWQLDVERQKRRLVEQDRQAQEHRAAQQARRAAQARADQDQREFEKWRQVPPPVRETPQPRS